MRTPKRRGGSASSAATGSDDELAKTTNTMKNPNGRSIEEIDDMHDAQRDEQERDDEIRADDLRLRALTKELRELHAKAEAAQWSAVDDTGEMNNKHATMETFNVSAWNNIPWILDAAEHLQKWVAVLARTAADAQCKAKALEDIDPRESASYKVKVMEADEWRKVATMFANATCPSHIKASQLAPNFRRALEAYDALRDKADSSGIGWCTCGPCVRGEPCERVQTAGKIGGLDAAELVDATTDAYNAIRNTLDTMLACDHVSMLRHPQIVDGLHRALGTLKRALHQNA